MDFLYKKRCTAITFMVHSPILSLSPGATMCTSMQLLSGTTLNLKSCKNIYSKKKDQIFPVVKRDC